SCLHEVVTRTIERAKNPIVFLIILFNFYNKPLPVFTKRSFFSNSFTKLSKIPLIKILLFGVEYSFAISKYSLIVTFAGIDGNFNNSQIAILRIIVSISAIRSTSQFGVLSIYSLDNSTSFNTVL